MATTYHKPEALSDQITHYCPGCTHGVAHRLVAEVIDELGIRGRTFGIAPVGCAVLMYNYFKYYPLGEFKTPELFGAQNSRLKAQSN
jgi:pyruvate/2-oxoacid:ferredoxin oxidoreductase beta subunit